MKIYRNGVEVTTVKPLDSSYVKAAVMAENSFFLEFYTPTAIDIRRGDYCTALGKIYFIAKVPLPVLSKGVYRYTLTLLSTREETMKAILMQYDDPEVIYTCSPMELLTLVVESMQRLQPAAGWAVGDCIIGDMLTLSFSAQSCYEALNSACSAENWNTEWYTEGYTIHLKKQEFTPNDIPVFSIGAGLVTITPENNDTDYYTRLYAYGSTRNMVDGKRLVMDVPYLQVANPTTIIEHIEKFDEVYPRLVNAAVTHLPVTPDITKFADQNLDFNPKELQIDGLAMHIVFLSGALLGLDFEVNYNVDTFQLIPFTDEAGLTWPNETANPQIDDRYVLYNVNMPLAYKTAAMAELKAKAQALLDSRSNEPISLNVTTDEGYFFESGTVLSLGDIVTVQDSEIPPLIAGRNIRITEFKRRLNSPYKYDSVKLSDIVYSNPLTAATTAIEQTHEYIAKAGLTNPRYSARNWRDSQELIHMINGAVTNFTEGITPITVQTMAMLVGDESLQYRFVNSKTTPVVVSHEFLYNPLTRVLSIEAGIIQHMTLGLSNISSSHAVSEYKFWDVMAFESDPLITINEAYYLYLVCSKTGTSGHFILSTDKMEMVGADYYFFLVGILNSEYNSDRSFSALYGFVEITPGRVRADKIVSTDGTTYIDLINKIIKGNFQFLSGTSVLDAVTGAQQTANTANSLVTTLQSYVESVKNNLQDQIDGNIISWFGAVDPTLANAPAVDWDTEDLRNMHANDTYTNTASGGSWRFQFNSSTHTWEWGVISDTATQQALAAAAHAQDTADGKRRVFTVTPFVPYDEGDLWVNANYGDGELVNELMRCSVSVDELGTFDVSDWEKASKYTDDTAAAAAQQSANTANALLSDIASDSKLTPGEKKQVKKEWDIIVGEKTKLDAQADEFEVTRTAYDAAYSQLSTYIGPLIADLTTTDTIVGATFRTKFKTYYDAKIDLIKLVATEGKNLTESAQMDAGDAMATAQEALGDALVANQAIANIASDNVLSAVEKSAERLRWNTIASELAGLDAQATLAGLTTEKTTYDNAFQALATYLNNGTAWTTGVPTWLADANLGTNTTIAGATYRTKWKDYYDARTGLLNAVSVAVKAMAQSSDYLKAAMAGDTTIAGGLALLNLLLLKDALGNINGGISGLASDNVGVWTGGSHTQAVAELAKNILFKDGKIRLADGDITYSEELGLIISAMIRTSISGERIEIDKVNNSIKIFDSDGTAKMIISPQAVTTAANIGGETQHEAVAYGAYSSYIEADGEEVIITTETLALDPASIWDITLPDVSYDLSVSGDYNGLTKIHYIGSVNVNVRLLDAVTGARIRSYGVSLSADTSTVVTDFGTLEGRKFSGLPGGTYKIEVSLSMTHEGAGVGSVDASLGAGQELSADSIVSYAQLGYDGFNFINSLVNYFHYAASDGLVYKGAMNIPGVLAAMSFDSAGTQDINKNWGKKSAASSSGYTAVGQYHVPHAIGHANYTAQITCLAAGAVGTVVLKGTDYVNIVIQRNGSNYPSGFDIVLIGNNN